MADRRKWFVAGVALVFAGALQVVTAVPASAAVPGLQVVSAVSAADSSSPKSALATCPAGKRVIGTGFYIDGVEGRVSIDDLIPTATTVLATGYETQPGTNAIWWIRAFAVCANPLPGLEIVAVSSGADSMTKATTATCPAGKQALGSGAAIAAGTGEVMLDALVPSGAAVSAVAYEDGDGTTAAWTLSAFAICASAPAGLQVVASRTVNDSTNKFDTPTCPAGTVPLSLGWDISSRAAGEILIDIAMPTATGALVAAREGGAGVSTSWTLTTRAVCATP
jgi:hypothetical protein